MYGLSSTHIVNGTLNVNETIKLAESGAQRFAKQSPVHNLDPHSSPVSSQKPIASLPLDLDNKWTYLKIHGDPGWESFPPYLDILVPRVPDPGTARTSDHIFRGRVIANIEGSKRIYPYDRPFALSAIRTGTCCRTSLRRVRSAARENAF
jgi:hypothetical protein